MDNLVGSQSVLSAVAFPAQITYMVSLLYVLFHVPVDTKISESFSGQVVTRMDSSRTYPYGQLGGFSKCPFCRSISRTSHIYKVSLLYVFSYASLDGKISESFYYRDCKGKAYMEISWLSHHFLEVIYLKLINIIVNERPNPNKNLNKLIRLWYLTRKTPITTAADDKELRALRG